MNRGGKHQIFLRAPDQARRRIRLHPLQHQVPQNQPLPQPKAVHYHPPHPLPSLGQVLANQRLHSRLSRKSNPKNSRRSRSPRWTGAHMSLVLKKILRWLRRAVLRTSLSRIGGVAGTLRKSRSLSVWRIVGRSCLRRVGREGGRIEST